MPWLTDSGGQSRKNCGTKYKKNLYVVSAKLFLCSLNEILITHCFNGKFICLKHCSIVNYKYIDNYFPQSRTKDLPQLKTLLFLENTIIIANKGDLR